VRGRHAVHGSTPANDGGVADKRAVAFDRSKSKWSCRRGSSTKKVFIVIKFEHRILNSFLIERIA
jgi:hypothetical protein